MAILTTGNTFADGDQVTAAALNASTNSATFASGAVDNASTQLSSGAIIVKDGGITTAKLNDASVTTAKLSTGAPSWDASGNLTVGGSLNTVGNTLQSGDSSSNLVLFGGDSNGSNIELYGATHPTSADQIYIDSEDLFFRDTTASSTKAKIDSSGRFLIGPTLNTSPVVNGEDGIKLDPTGLIEVENTNATSLRLGRSDGVGTVVDIRYNTGLVGSISVSETSTGYNTTSDYRLKEDIVKIENASGRVKKLKPCNFSWKSTAEKVDGFIAHELQDVVPNAVQGEKDEIDSEGNPQYQSIDQSKIVPLLTSALQEALLRIEALEAK